MFSFLEDYHPRLSKALIISFYILLALLLCLIIWRCCSGSSAKVKTTIHTPKVSPEEVALFMELSIAAQSLAQAIDNANAEAAAARSMPNSQVEATSAVSLGGLTQAQLAELSSQTFVDLTGGIAGTFSALGSPVTALALGNSIRPSNRCSFTIEDLIRNGNFDLKAGFSPQLRGMAQTLGLAVEERVGGILEGNQGSAYLAACSSRLCIIADPGLFEGGVGTTPVVPSPELAGRSRALGMFRVLQPLFERDGMFHGSRVRVILPGGVFEEAFRSQWGDCIRCTANQCMRERLEMFSCPEIFAQGVKARGSACPVMQ